MPVQDSSLSQSQASQANRGRRQRIPLTPARFQTSECNNFQLPDSRPRSCLSRPLIFLSLLCLSLPQLQPHQPKPPSTGSRTQSGPPFPQPQLCMCATKDSESCQEIEIFAEPPASACSIVAPYVSIRQHLTTMWRLPLAERGKSFSDWPLGCLQCPPKLLSNKLF